ncbi:pilus assembly protein PilP [Francisellaceae bacterium]|nr:pilus assembly protein PilP [Francisellaceae bacterium]
MKRTSNYLVTASILAIMLGSSGCTDSNNQDLKKFIENAEKNAISSPIEKLPRLKNYTPYQYTSKNLRTPFSLANTADIEDISLQTGIEIPDLNRTKGELENYPLSSLKLVGVIEQNGRYWGLVLSGDHRVVHVVKVDDYIGIDHGKIIKINKDEMVVREIKKSLSGTWIEKEATLKISTDDEINEISNQ